MIKKAIIGNVQFSKNIMKNFVKLKLIFPYRQGHAQAGKRKLGSPVRIFTNLPLNQIILDNLDNYRLCQTCNIYVSLTNRHCQECSSCTGKNGGLYKHCYECSRCVKHSWEHCITCQRCTLPDHSCLSPRKKQKI